METPAKTADVVLKKGESKGVVLVCGSGDMEQLGLPESMSKWRKFPTLIKSLLVNCYPCFCVVYLLFFWLVEAIDSLFFGSQNAVRFRPCECSCRRTM